MVDRIGAGGSLAQEAIKAALQSHKSAVSGVASEASQISPGSQATEAGESNFQSALSKGIQAIDKEIQAAEDLPEDLVTGKVENFHEVAVQLKKAELSFRFSMEIRNKLIDAYREVMRMGV